MGRSSPLRRVASRELRFEPLEERQLLAVGPQLIGINPSEGEVLEDGATLHAAPQELTFRFNEGQVIDAATLGGIEISRSGQDDVLGNSNDVIVTPGFIGIGGQPNEVVVRFADTLPDDLYRITIVGAGANRLANELGQPFNGGTNQRIDFDLDLGAQVIAVVPQPTDRDAGGALTQLRDQIVVYFNDDDLHPDAVTTGELATDPTVVDPQFYQLIFTNDTLTNTDDQVFTPSSVSYDPATDSAVLTFAGDLAELPAGPGIYRLRIGSNEQLPQPPVVLTLGVAEDPGSSFDTAYDLGALTAQSQIIQSAIEPQLFPIEFPGTAEEPGHREEIVEDHVPDGPDNMAGITVMAFNFQSVYDTDSDGNPLYNLISEAQKDMARKILDLYGYYLGVTFVETATEGLTIASGDIGGDSGPGGYAAAIGRDPDIVIMDHSEDWSDDVSFGGGWFDTAFGSVGFVLGLHDAYELPDITVMNGTGLDGEPVYPGDHDIVHGRYLHRPEGNDIDLYRFTVDQEGVFTAETFAERLEYASLLDTAISLYVDVGDQLELIARNDDYYSEDSFLEMRLGPGEYVIGVSSSGNREFDPTVEDTGLYGTTDGQYELRLDFRPVEGTALVDITGTPLDGDGDGLAGGAYNFWFRVQTPENTLFVDKLAEGGAGADGSLALPYRTLVEAFANAQFGDVVRVVGNGGTDGELATVEDNAAFLFGFDSLGHALEDGSTVKIPRGVTVMVDAGTIFKAQDGAIEVGSSASTIDRSGGALQVLGTPEMPVFFTSYNDEEIGEDANPSVVQTPSAGNWGGIIFRNDLDRASTGRVDYEAQGIFLNHVNHADIRYGGGEVVIDSRRQIITPIQMVDARPTITFNAISHSADAALAATPNSFEETNFHTPQYQTTPFTSDYDRIGPEILGNDLSDNSINGLFIRIHTPLGTELQPLTVSARFDDTDIVHVLSENLIIQGTPGGPWYDERTGILEGRLDARLAVDPGTVVKLGGAHIRVGFGAQLIAEGLSGNSVVFTSLLDDTYGAGGNVDTTSDGAASGPVAGDWGGIYFAATSSGSLDYARLRYGGGVTRLKSEFAGFNVIDIEQAAVRITNSILEYNADGTGGQGPSNRFGLLSNEAATIHVRGAQPVLVGNVIRHNAGPAISINVNALHHFVVTDFGRSTGSVDLVEGYGNNFGPLVRDNRLEDNSINGMVVRGGTLTTQSVWDDTDIVHVVTNEIIIPDYHSFGGLRLQSSPNESLVVKLSGGQAGFTASGRPLDITDRIGGMIHVIGQPGAPVVLTSLADDTVSAGVRPDGTPAGDTNNDGDATGPNPGDWRSIAIDEYAHDRNVVVYVEQEAYDLIAPGDNATGDEAEFLGILAPREHASDENRRLGFEVHGYLSEPGDVDVFSFQAEAGTEVWLDVDRTSQALDTVIELIDRDGNVVARSDNSLDEAADPSLLVGSARLMQRLPPQGGRDFSAVNPKDAGMRVILPGAEGTTNIYHIRVRSSSDDLDYLDAGKTSGVYQLGIRLRETDELAGCSVRYADIRYATNGIEVHGQPGHSPLLCEAAEASTEGGGQEDVSGTITVVAGDQLTDGLTLTIAETVFELNDLDNPGDPELSDPQAIAVDYHGGDPDASPAVAPDTEAAVAQALAAAINAAFEAEEEEITASARGPNVSISGLEGEDPEVPAPLVYRTGGLFGSGDTQDLGNYLETDRAVIAVAGALSGNTDIDFYEFRVDHVSVRSESTNYFVGTVFDIDYADGLARGDITLSIFDSSGRLILVSSDGNALDDRPVGGASDIGNLAAGSLGPLDPLLGTVELGQGTYTVAVTADCQWAQELEQFTNANPTNPLLRLEPITSLIRIAEDHIDSSSYSTAAEPVVEVLLDEEGVVPYSFGDVRLFVCKAGGGEDPGGGPGGGPAPWGQLLTINPFTGVTEVANGNINPAIGDLVLRSDGTLVAFTLDVDDGDPQDSAAGNLIQIDAGNAGVTDVGDDGIITYEQSDDEETPEEAVVRDTGVHFQAMAVGQLSGAQRLLAIGYRGDLLEAADAREGRGVDFMENILYVFDPNTGAAQNLIGQDQTRFTGAGTNAVERGQILTAPVLVAAAGSDLADAMTFTLDGTVFEFDNVGGDLSGTIIAVAGTELTDGLTFVMADTTFEFDDQEDPAGPGLLDPEATAVPYVAADTDVLVAQAIAEAINGALGPDITATAQGANVALTGLENPPEVNAPLTFDDPTGTEDPDATAIEFTAADTATTVAQAIADAINAALGPTVTATASGRNVTLEGNDAPPEVTEPLEYVGGGPGGRITGMAVLGGEVYAVSDTGGLWHITDPLGTEATADYIESSALDLLGIEFAGLTPGPSSVEGGLYSDLLFGIATDGTLYAFGTDGVLQPIFVGGAVSLATEATSVAGLAFSDLERNLWQITSNRGRDLGHGIELSFDNERHTRRTEGGSSFYFGTGGGGPGGGGGGNYDFAGGAQGTLISNPFDLSEYSAADKPVLYFSYFAVTEGSAYSSGGEQGAVSMRDAFRVYASQGDSGEWHLLATNDSSSSEQSYSDPEGIVEVEVQELFDYTDPDGASWRQVRIPLDGLAGLSDVRLRFEFSTAGSIGLGDPLTGGYELQAAPGVQLLDGNYFEIDTHFFEFDLGYTLDLPGGRDLSEGHTIVVDGPMTRATFEFDTDGEVEGAILVPSGSLLSDGETFSISDGVATELFEFDCGYSILVPEAGGDPAGGGVTVGRYFTIDDNVGSGELLFRFTTPDQPGSGDVIIEITEESTQDEVADLIVAAIEGAGLNLSPTNLGGGQVHVGGTTHTITLAGGVNLELRGEPGPQNGGIPIAFVPSDSASPAADLAVAIADEIENSGLNVNANASGSALILEEDAAEFIPGTSAVAFVDNTPIGFSETDPAGAIAARLEWALLEAEESLGVTPHLDGNRLNFENAVSVTVSIGSNIVRVGRSGVSDPEAIPVPIHQGMTAEEVAQAMAEAMTPILAGFHKQIAVLDGPQIVPDDTFTITSGTDTLTIVLDATYATLTADEVAEALTIIINDADLGITASAEGRRINLLGEELTVDPGLTGFSVFDPVPINSSVHFVRVVGYESISSDSLYVTTEMWGDEYSDYNSPGRAQANNFEGVYVDDLIIGFASRGEMATAANVNTNFTTANPPYGLSGAYQLEIRRGSDYGSGTGYLTLDRSFDPNDRLTTATTLVAPRGSDIYEGQSFTIGNGIDTVTFTFENVGAEPLVEDGDNVSKAIETGLVPGSSSFFAARSAVDDELDVDFFAVDLAVGDVLEIDVDAWDLGSALDSVLMLFDEDGVELAYNDIGSAPGEEFTYDTYIAYTALTAGRYYVGVSSYPNGYYDPFVSESGLAGYSLGDYIIEFSLNGGEPLVANAIQFTPSDTAAEIAAAITDAINRSEVQAILDVWASSTPRGTRIDLWGSVTLIAGFAPTMLEPNDTLADACDSGIAPGENSSFAARGDIGDNPQLDPGYDVDMIRLELTAGDTIFVDVDAEIDGSSLDSMLRLFDATGVELAYDDDTEAPDEPTSYDSYLEYTVADSGVYYVGVSGYSNLDYDPQLAGSGSSGSTGFYNIEISRSGAGGIAGIGVIFQQEFGDTNHFRDQGQLLIESNFISYCQEFGIVVDAAERVGPSDSPQPRQGPVRVLIYLNEEELAPAATIVNNVLAYNQGGGILFSGDTTEAGDQQAPVPYGRILNNTIYGTSSGDVGIQITDNASPTVLNNILANLETGLDIDDGSQTTVLGGLLFQGNDTNSTGGLGDNAIVLANGEPLFVDPDNGNFYLDIGSRAIDSALKSLEDRPEMIRVREPMYIDNAPVLAPELDAFGSYRSDDPDVRTPPGIGETVFVDRGAIDRVDFDGPLAELITPPDSDGDTFVQRDAGLAEFVIQIKDGGVGVADSTVTGSMVSVERNGVLLVQGQDYTFRYSETTNRIRLAAGSGAWALGTYWISLDNTPDTGIRDDANNPLRPNQDDGTTTFVIQLGGGADYGDAPDPSYPSLRPAGANHQILSGFFLGYGVDADSNGEPSSDADLDAFDDGVTFDGRLILRSEAQVTVRASAAGRLDAWIDFDRDGTWEAAEKIFSNQPLVAGLNTLTFDVSDGGTEVAGVSFARFRFSTVGGLAPTGPANSGEVEDYQVLLEVPDWQNPAYHLDVNDDGVLSSQDVLLLANFLYFIGQSEVPEGVPPPPYYDVNGDGWVLFGDAWEVAGALGNPPNPEPEAEQSLGGETGPSSPLTDPLAASVTVGGIAGATDSIAEASSDYLVVSALLFEETLMPSMSIGGIRDGNIAQVATDSADSVVSAVDQVMARGLPAVDADFVDDIDFVDVGSSTVMAPSDSVTLDDFFAELDDATQFEEFDELAAAAMGDDRK